jgi:hypothetical protein
MILFWPHKNCVEKMGFKSVEKELTVSALAWLQQLGEFQFF